jgi:hypothetical protein
MKKATVLTTALLLISTCLWFSTKSMAQEDLPAYLKDRGTGQPTSMFGTYIHEGELLIYPFYEYYRDNDLEYKPAELGYGLDEDFRGKYRANEGLIFVGYGITDWLAVEFEAAIIKASLEKSPDDPSNMPARIEESGSGDVEGQIRARWQRENERRPEIFSYFEAVSPQQKDKLLIGTPDWELKLGSGLIKGFSWGTLTARAGVEYLLEDSSWDLGEFAVEYLKRLSPSWRIYLGVEGTQDEIGLITEVQCHFSDAAYLKFNNGFGITSKATDWAPEIGVIFSLR